MATGLPRMPSKTTTAEDQLSTIPKNQYLGCKSQLNLSDQLGSFSGFRSLLSLNQHANPLGRDFSTESGIFDPFRSPQLPSLLYSAPKTSLGLGSQSQLKKPASQI